MWPDWGDARRHGRRHPTRRHRPQSVSPSATSSTTWRLHLSAIVPAAHRGRRVFSGTVDGEPLELSGENGFARSRQGTFSFSQYVIEALTREEFATGPRPSAGRGASGSSWAEPFTIPQMTDPAKHERGRPRRPGPAPGPRDTRPDVYDPGIGRWSYTARGPHRGRGRSTPRPSPAPWRTSSPAMIDPPHPARRGSVSGSWGRR